MDKAEARRKLKGLQLIVTNRADEEIEKVFEEAAKYIELERPKKKKRSERGGRDRQESGGHDRGGE